MKYQVNKPVKFKDHFSFFEDRSAWNGEYRKTKNGCFPSFSGNFRQTNLKSYKNYIKPESNYAQQYCFSGIYMIFFTNRKLYYVGIASDNIQDRLSKHIVKVFGSYLGQGINHTNERDKGWRSIAKEILTKNTNYKLDDCYIVTINPIDKNLIAEVSYKDKLQYIEKELSNQHHRMIELIIKSIDYNSTNNDWISFNKKNKGLEHEYQLLHWGK
ncbi:GIY-YIG nuclease family protein [Candidatus Levibacter sp. Uisw_134_01]|uniref:GIY-YIG nuclease family protein n=1 Tax=Candidatus Levibacter sp. Uisw_134_01 TaxID=3230999 RepID=UPI003D4A95D3